MQSALGSLLHGALMERLPRKLVELHEQDMRPATVRKRFVGRGGLRRLAHRRRGGRGRRGDPCGKEMAYSCDRRSEVRLGERKLLAESTGRLPIRSSYGEDAQGRGAFLLRRRSSARALCDAASFFLICQSQHGCDGILRQRKFISYDEDLTERMTLACQLSKYAKVIRFVALRHDARAVSARTACGGF